ncbi:hypothetical protein [Streptacidiphilus monticola]|uniref:Tetratricopeptide repeat protein n=1 Tax=Streptacidiphilus monticola TaxID=2161674 RepID=A0ABW1FV24_9ACTN
MKQLARRLGRTLAFVLPVVMVTTGTLAVTRVNWAPPSSSDANMLAAAARADAQNQAHAQAPQDALRDRLLRELRTGNPGTALNGLQRAMEQHPDLRAYCTGIARELGQAAVRKYQGDVKRALSYARPVCDASFASGATAAGAAH